jgi:hypothetical protein
MHPDSDVVEALRESHLRTHFSLLNSPPTGSIIRLLIQRTRHSGSAGVRGLVNRPARCDVCGGELYHEPTCELAREEYVLGALQALRWAYVGAPLHTICPCELGYPGVLGCTHARPAVRVSRSAGKEAASPAL